MFNQIYRLHGSYEALKYGNLLDGLADLTGGITESLLITELGDPQTLAALLKTTSVVTAYLPGLGNVSIFIYIHALISTKFNIVKFLKFWVPT